MPLPAGTAPYGEGSSLGARDLVEPVATLDAFIDAVNATEGVDVRLLEPLTTLHVRTCNTCYRLVVSSGASVLVEGGRFFPEVTSAHLGGASLGGSFLKIGWIGLGLRMEIHAGGQRIITSPVRGIVAEVSPATATVH